MQSTANESEETYLMTSDSLSSHDDEPNENDEQCNRRRHSRLSKLKERSYKTAMYIENNYLTLPNFKVAVSFVLWWLCYMFMGIFVNLLKFFHGNLNHSFSYLK